MVAPTIDRESQVPAYSLPELLAFQSGKPVRRPEDWPRRRSEILQLFGDHLYGHPPTAAVSVKATDQSDIPDALQGLASFRQFNLVLRNKNHRLSVGLLLALPNHMDGPVPAFLGLNFYGNHTVHSDPRIRLHQNWSENNEALNITGNRACTASRGCRAYRWPLATVLQRGYAVATVYAGDFDPDFHDGFTNGVHGLFEENDYASPPAHRWGTIAAWAWGLSRVLEFLQSVPAINARRVIAVGHSRMGKAALLAAARDPRFAAAVSNDSGCAGAALSRRRFGERFVHLQERFPHWLCPAAIAYRENENALPVDQHQLLACLAPRPLYVASATEDDWSDPYGEFLSLTKAEPAYHLLGFPGLPQHQWPDPDVPVLGHLAYHLRSGPHDIFENDWSAFLNFADAFLSQSS